MAVALTAVLGTLLDARPGAAQAGFASDFGPHDADALREALPGDVGACGAVSGATARCHVARRFASDPAARADALALYDAHAVVVGVEPPWTMDGGFRGTITLVPELPVGRHRRLLSWVRGAHDALAQVLSGIAPSARVPVRYRHRGVLYQFTRSVRRTTPSAYASGARIGFNVSGSLHRSADAVLGTLVHELFHLNDERADGSRWSTSALGPLHARILARCGDDARCLRPYAPTPLRVRGGTYYAFQPDNGEMVVEYAADLAQRWFVEHRALATRGRLREAPWKCATPENAEAYRAIADAYFGGVDRTPACPR